MTTPLVETKLHRPATRRALVPRRRLLTQVEEASDAKLVLVSAPAGFGKTTLVAEWLASLPGDATIAWLSLDERDNDPRQFWASVLASLDHAMPGLGSSARSLIDAGSAPIDAVLSALVNDLHAFDRDVTLVLDDFHVVEHLELHDGMTFLLEHLPARTQLVITTRIDPSLPLARLRARGELAEVRAADLRFTADEASTYLTDAMGLTLTADDIATLEARTEGWIAALQLAAISMRGRDDVADFIAGFAGDDRFIVDYLVGEVLQRQPEEIRRFLLQTSVLDRLQGALCDAVTGGTDGKATLEALDRQNLFVVTLDDRREWYRYHHLFADVLRAHLLDEGSDSPDDLHRRASTWYASQDDPSNAIRHALAGHDPGRAAELAELTMPVMRRDRRDAELHEWKRSIPDDVVSTRPVLAVGFCGVAMASDTPSRIRATLDKIEEWLALPANERAAAGMTVVDDAQLAMLPGAIEMYRAALALTDGDLDATVAHARRVLELAEGNDEHGGAAYALLGLAAWSGGDLDTAFDFYTESVDCMRRIDHIADVLGVTMQMADIRVAQGRLRDAAHLYEQGLQLMEQRAARPLRGAADMHVGLAEISRERDERDAAADHLRRAQELERYATPQYEYRSRTVQAGLRLADGDVAGCLALLNDAERVYDTDFSPTVRPVAARRARTQVLLGDRAAARAWVRDHGLSLSDELRYVTEFEHVTLAIVVLNDQPDTRELQRVRALLDRLLVDAEAGGRGASVIEILAVQALAFDALGDTANALAALRRAVVLAAPERSVRVFTFLGPRLAELRDALDHGAAPSRAARDGLVEPLSDRELDVLRLLRSDLSGPDIARELVVSLNTVRTHTKHIYTKLGVSNRREAVTRATQLGL